MKIKTNIYSGLEISLKVKGLENEQYNEEDTKAFLNWLCGIAHNAAHNHETKGRPTLQKEAADFADLLYNILGEAGYYDNIRNK